MVEVCPNFFLRAEDESAQDEVLGCRRVTLEGQELIEQFWLVEADADPDADRILDDDLILERHLLLLHDVKDEGEDLLL